jgi:hypothetical protein
MSSHITPRSLALAIALLLLANAAVGRWNYVNAALNIDYFTLWSVPHALSSRTLSSGAAPNIYLPETQRDIRADVRAANINQIQLLALVLFILLSSVDKRVLARSVDCDSRIIRGYGVCRKRTKSRVRHHEGAWAEERAQPSRPFHRWRLTGHPTPAQVDTKGRCFTFEAWRRER